MLKKTYREYLSSAEFKREKVKAWERLGGACLICFDLSKSIHWHHFKGYGAIWTHEDHLFIVPLCSTHHLLCHYRFWPPFKVSLTRIALYRRFIQVKRNYLGRMRPSIIIERLLQSGNRE